MANIKSCSSKQKISSLLKIIQPAARLEILLAIGMGEACVCHLETLLGYRQAYISQHLMALREAAILETRRDGRYIYYQLNNHQLLELILNAGEVVGIAAEDLTVCTQNSPIPKCCCPNCLEELSAVKTMQESST